MPTAGIPAGILSALSFGAGDFSGAVASRRAGALAVVAAAHGIGLVLLVAAAVVLRPPLPPMGGILLGVAAGIAGAVGIGALFRGMSLGSMGLVAAISGVGSLSLPLVAGAILGADVRPVQLLGVGLAGAAAVAASGASRSEVGRRALVLAAVAAAGFGAWYVLIDLAARESGILWALVWSRAASAVGSGAVALVLGVGRRPPWAIVAAAAVLDVGGNAFYVFARETIPIGLAAALSGLYPVVTMLLARAFLGERLPRLGYLGVVLAIGGVVLISLG